MDVVKLGIVVDASGAITVLDQFGKKVQTVASQTDSLGRATQRAGRDLRTFLSLVGVSLGVREIVQYADTWRLIESRLKLVTQSTGELRAAQQALFDISQRTRTDFEATATLYTRVARNAQQLGKSQQDLAKFTETVQKTLKLSGASAGEASAGVIQLSQAIASGVLRGDEFRSVAENMPGLAKAIADGLGVSIGALRQMANQGELTADKVVNSVLKMKDSVDRDFKTVPVTIGDAFTILKNELGKFIGQMNSASGAGNTFADAIISISNHLPTIAALIGAAAAAWVAYKTAALGAIAVNAIVAGAGTVAAFLSLARAVRSVADGMALLSLLGGGVKGVVVTLAALGAGFAAYKLITEQIAKATADFEAQLGKLSGTATGTGTAVGVVTDAFKAHAAELAGELVKLKALNAAQGQSELQLKTLEILYDAEIENSKLAADFKGKELSVLVRLNNSIADQKIRALELADALEEEKFARQENIKAQEKELDIALKIIEAAEKERLAKLKLIGIDPDKIQEDAHNTAKDAADDIVKQAKDAAERQRQIAENLIRSVQSSFSDFFVGIFNGGLSSFRRLFDSLKQLYFKMIADLLAAKVVTKIFGDKGIGAQQLTAGNIMQTASLNMLTAANVFAGKSVSGAVPTTGTGSLGKLGSGIGVAAAGFGIGYGIGQSTGSVTTGGIGGAAGGALTGAAIGSIIPGFGTAVGAVVGGLAGLAGGLLGGSKAAAEAAKQLQQLRIAAEASIAAFKQQAKGYQTLDERIAEVARDAGQRRLQALAAHPDDAIYYKGKDTGLAKPGSELEREYAEIAKAQAEYVERLKEEARLKNEQFKEDLQVRLLRAQGHEKEADRLALEQQQARERAELQKQIDAGLADEATKALLLQVQAAELLKKTVDQLNTSVRNAPSGFKIESYIQQFATARRFNPPVSPIYPGPERPTFPTLRPETPKYNVTTSTGNTYNITGPVYIDAKTKTPKEAFDEWGRSFNAFRSVTTGLNSDPADALSLLPT